MKIFNKVKEFNMETWKQSRIQPRSHLLSKEIQFIFWQEWT